MTKPKQPFDEFVGISNVPRLFTGNNTVQFKNVLQYEFINLSNVPVIINGQIFLDRYFSGSPPPAIPTIISGAAYRWAPLMKAGERDTSQYSFVFQDKWYGNVTVYRRLYVVTKLYSPGN